MGPLSSTERLRSCCGGFVTTIERFCFQRVGALRQILVESDQQSREK